jgi:hypothetical protein
MSGIVTASDTEDSQPATVSFSPECGNLQAILLGGLGQGQGTVYGGICHLGTQLKANIHAGFFAVLGLKSCFWGYGWFVALERCLHRLEQNRFVTRVLRPLIQFGISLPHPSHLRLVGRSMPTSPINLSFSWRL